jgi:hypothetical protein
MTHVSQNRWSQLWAGAAIIGVLCFYAWTVAAANGLTPAVGTAYKYDYYNHLVHGLQKGHLSLDVEVPAALKALPDPYDPAANRDIGLIDTSYYHGRYYLYFGPTPAITLMLPFRALTGTDLPTGWAVLIFTSIGFIAAASLWLAIRGRYFVTSPTWMAPLGVIVLGFGCMVGAVLRRPLFWELAVASGFAFGMLALAATYRAIHDQKRPARWLFCAGLCLGLAAAARPTYLFGATILVVPIWYWWRNGASAAGSSSSIGRLWLAATLPFGALVVGIMAYNYVRFDNPFEFGHNYQLSVAYESKVRQFSLSYFLFNLKLYYFLPAQWSWQLPFASPTSIPISEWPRGFYTVDDVCGLFTEFPFAGLAALAPFALTCRTPKVRQRIGAALTAMLVLWLGIGGVMAFFVATVARYMVDFVPGLMLLGAIGFLAAESRTRNSWRRWPTRAALLVLAMWTIAGGTFANFEFGRTLPQQSPALTNAFLATANRLEALYDRLAGRHFGPVALTLRFPRSPTPRVETLLQVGAVPQQDRILVEYTPDHRIRFGVQHESGPTRWSISRAIDSTKQHQLRIDAGAFYPHLGHRFYGTASYAQASWLTHRVAIELDGVSVLQSLAQFDSHSEGVPRSVATAFTGEVSSLTPTEVDPRTAVPQPPPQRKLDIPANGENAGQLLPLVATGKPGAGDILFLEQIDEHRARLGYDHWAAPVLFSEPFSFERSATHSIELHQDECGWAPITDSPRLLHVTVDGDTVWHSYALAYACSPDQVYFGKNPNGHSTCAGTFPELKVSDTANLGAAAGRVLLIRLLLPPGEKRAWLPIVTIGNTSATDSLSIGYIDTSAVELRFLHTGGQLLFSQRIELGANPGHDLELSLPSFEPGTFGRPADGEVVVHWDGREVMRASTAAAAFDANEIRFGERPAGSTMTAKYFTGAIVSHQWLTPR